MIKKILLGVLIVSGFGFSDENYISNYFNTYWFKKLVAWKTNLSMMYIKNDLVYVIKKENNNSCWYEQYNENSTRSKFLMTFQKNKLRTDYTIEYDSSGKVVNEYKSEIFNYIIPGTVGEGLYEICRDAKSVDYLTRISKFNNDFTNFSIKHNFYGFDSLYKYDSTKSISTHSKMITAIKYDYDKILVLDVSGSILVYEFAKDSCDTNSSDPLKYFYQTSYSIDGKIQHKDRVGFWETLYVDIFVMFSNKKDKYYNKHNNCSELFYTRNK